MGLGALGTSEISLEAAQKKKPIVRKKRPDPLRGSAKSMDRQRSIAEREDLTYLNNEAELKDFVKKGLLVSLPDNSNIGFDPYLSMEGDIKGKNGKLVGRKYNRAFCRPWAKNFLENLSREYRTAFPKGPKLMVTSAVRPRDVQNVLRKNNPNASAHSVHLTGSAIDLVYGTIPERNLDGSFIWETDFNTKKRRVKNIYPGLSLVQKNWIAHELRTLETLGKKIEATQERMEPCFHIMVSKEYK